MKEKMKQFLNNAIYSCLNKNIKANIFFLFIFVLMIIRTIIDIEKVPLGFDESYNLQIPVNIILGNGYSTFTGPFRPFNYEITTGFPTLIPVAIIFKLFGIGVLQYRIVTIAFYSGLLVLIYLISKVISNKWIALIPPILFFIITNPSRTSVNAFELIGEIPALLFVLLAFYFIQLSFVKPDKNLIFSVLVGVFLSLAYFSKSIFLLAIPAIFIVYFYKIFIKKEKNYLISIVLVLMIIFFSDRLWNIVILKNLGISRYEDYLLLKRNFFIYAGSGVTENGFVFSLASINEKFTVFIQNIGLRLRWIVLLAIGIVEIQLIRLYKERITDLEMLLSLFALVYFCWWFGISNNLVNFRHIIPAVIICLPLVSALFTSISDLFSAKIQFFFNKSVAFCSIICIVIVFITRQVSPFNNLEVQRTFAAELEQYNDYQIVYKGWWQNPEFSFLLQKAFMKIEEYKIINNPADPIMIFTNTWKNGEYNTYLEMKSKCKKTLIEMDDFEACFVDITQ